MAFVREKISKEDFEKYQIGRYGERISNSIYEGSTWTIDREKNIYLVRAGGGGPEPELSNLHRFIFYHNANVYIVSMFSTLFNTSDKHWLIEWKLRVWEFVSYFSSTKEDRVSNSLLRPVFEDAMRTFQFEGIEDSFNEKIDIVFPY